MKSVAGKLRQSAQAPAVPLPDSDALPLPRAGTLTPGRELLMLALCAGLLLLPTIYALPIARSELAVVSVCAADLSSCLTTKATDWAYWERATRHWRAYTDEPPPCIKTECRAYNIWVELLDRDL